MVERIGSLSGSRVMVTGGCGFIGSHVARALVERGAEVVVLDKMKHGPGPDVPAGVRVVRFALGEDDPATLGRHLTGVRSVLHLAAEKHSQEAPDPEAILTSNVMGTQALLRAAGQAGARKVVFASSLYAYGRTSLPAMVETETPCPHTVYGTSKLAGEHLTAVAARGAGFDWVVLRFFFVYGPGQQRGAGYKTVIVKNGERLLRGEQATVYGDGEQALDYVYVDDVVAATLLALEAPVSGETLNVASGQATSVNRLLDHLIAAAGGPSGRTTLPADATAGTCRVGSRERAERVLGWRPQVGIEEGLRRTLAWMREAHR